MWFAGIDWAWADKHPDVVVLDVAGQQVLSRRVAHSAAGLASLTAELRALAPAPEEVVCVVARAHGLLIAALLEAGLWVAPVNPRRSTGHARRRGQNPLNWMRCCWRARGGAPGRIGDGCGRTRLCWPSSRRSPATRRVSSANRRGWSTN